MNISREAATVQCPGESQHGQREGDSGEPTEGLAESIKESVSNSCYEIPDSEAEEEDVANTALEGPDRSQEADEGMNWGSWQLRIFICRDP
jgi:hypothetical protein